MNEVAYISFLRFSIQLFIAEFVFVFFWKKKDFFIVRLLGAAVGYLVFGTAVFYGCRKIPGNLPIIDMLYYISLFVLTMGMMLLCFQVNMKEVLFAGVCGYATQHIGFGCYTIFREFVHPSLPYIWDFLLLRILPYILVAAVVYFLLIRRYEGKGELIDRDIRMIVLALIILLTAIFLSVLVDNGEFGTEAEMIQNVLCKVYAIICSSLSVFVAFSMSRQNRIIHENEMMETMLHSMEEQQNLSKETVNIINIKCHDLKHRISKITGIEDEQEQKEYIEEIRNAVSIYDNIYQTGNSAMDLVLTQKGLLCEEKHIKISIMVDGTLLNFMHTTDVYALFGNLLDNAIESVMKEADVQKRIVSVHAQKRAQGIHIHVENYCREQVVFEEGIPLTSKKNKNYHGFGVRSIKYIAEKYKGDVLMQVQDNKFLVDILFYKHNS